MLKIGRQYDLHEEIQDIKIEFKSQYAVIWGTNKNIVKLNRNAQKKLYEILKKRFEVNK